METLTKNICDIVINEAISINEKIKGLNFLELLKISLAEKLLILLNKQKFPLNNIIDFEKKTEEKVRNFNIIVNYYINSISVNKKKIDNDSLFFSFNETSNFDIYKDEKKFISLLLYKNTGISLPKGTIINSKSIKNTLLIEIQNKDMDEILK
tara:strand:+ start:388 stop:846 length:459 start_codon:yes stop_codon:yes gene_type:complete